MGHTQTRNRIRNRTRSYKTASFELSAPELLIKYCNFPHFILPYSNAFLLVAPLVNAADRLLPVRVRAFPLQPPDLPLHLEMAPACQLQPSPGQPAHWITPLDQPTGQTG